MTAEDVAAYFNGSIKVELFEAVAETIKVHDRDPAAHAFLLTAYIQRAEMGAKSGVATLDEAGKVPAGQLPSYVDHETTAAQIPYTDNPNLDADTVQSGIDKVAQLAQDAGTAAEVAKRGGCVVDVVFGALYVGYAYSVSAGDIEVARGTVPSEMIVTVTGLPVSKTITATIVNVGGTNVVKSVNTPAYFTRQSINFASTYVFDLTFAFPDGTPIPHKTVGGLISTQGGNTVVTDSNGRCIGMAATATPTITMSFADYIGVADLSAVVTAQGLLTTKTVCPNRASINIHTIQSSSTYKLSPEILDYDISAIGAGGGGAIGTRESGTNNATGGHGGGGGEIVNAMGKARIPELTFSIGAGGLGGDSTKPAGDGGNTTVSQIGLTAKGGRKATTSSPGSSSNGGNGGDGARYLQTVYPPISYPAKRGGDRTVFPLNDPALPASGGGGGGGETHASGDIYGNSAGPEPGAYGGATCGGGGGTSGQGSMGRTPGGGGGGGIQYQYGGGRGGDGAVIIRWRYLA